MKSLHLAIITLLLLAFGLIMVATGKQLKIAEYQRAYSLCLTAHAEVSGASENACGAAQDRTHTEFLCNQTNSHCWLEIK